MTTLESMILVMVVGFPLGLFWLSGRAAAERATAIGQQACARAEVIWLDHSVHLLHMRLRRGSNGWLTWERDFRFEYSYEGDDRAHGHMTLRGHQLISLVGPMPREERVEQTAYRWPSSIGPTI
jgi:hypothetical protein